MGRNRVYGAWSSGQTAWFINRVEALIVRSEISDLEMQPFGLLFGVEIGLLRSCRVKNLDFKLFKIIKIGKYDLRVLKPI